MAEFLTVPQAAKAIKLSETRIRVLIRSGRLFAKRYGPAYLIRPADLAAVKVRKPGRPRKRP